MESLDHIFRLMAVSQVLIWSTYCVLFQRTQIGYIVLFLSLSVAGYLASPFSLEVGGVMVFDVIGGLLGNLVPALAWLLAFRLFADDLRVPKLFFGVALTYFVLRQLPVSIQSIFQDSTANLIFFLIPQCLKLGLVIHAVYITLRGRDSDLVESRLQLRTPAALAFAAVVATVILIEIGFNNDVPEFVRSGGAAILLLFVSLVSTMSLRVHPGLLAIVGEISEPEGCDTQASASGNENATIVRIQKVMDDERFYAKDEVTLHVLSQHLNLPAYKLRTVINQAMGFRNFNQFLNSYRIAEASAKLLNNRKLPILTIALDIGFRSLSAFNKAFKETHHITPTEFRLRSRSMTD